MEKKKIIEVAIIILAFAASGFILYKNLNKPGSSAPMAIMANLADGDLSVSQQVGAILPYGNKLDIQNELDKNNFQFGMIKFESVNISQEVGVGHLEIIKPIPVAETQGE